MRTLERWTQGDAVTSDGRLGASRPVPRNQLSEAERAEVLAVVNEPRLASLPPTQIMPKLADEGRYLASESTFYRLLRQADQLKHRGRAKAPQTRTVPRQCAQAPNQLWSWEISYLPGPVAGMYFHRAGLRARAHPDPARPPPGQRQPHEGFDLHCETR